MRGSRWSASRVALVCKEILNNWQYSRKGGNRLNPQNNDLITTVCKRHKMSEAHIRRILEVKQ